MIWLAGSKKPDRHSALFLTEGNFVILTTDIINEQKVDTLSLFVFKKKVELFFPFSLQL
jgi:hypothetical protein